MATSIKTVVSLADMRAFAAKIVSSLKGGEVLALIGELGAGKTTFTKTLLKNLGVRATVTSPTFVLMRPYRLAAARQAVHIDCYRVKSFADIQALGVTDAWGKKENIFVIEWADKIKSRLPKKTIYLRFKIKTRSGGKPKGGHRAYREISITNAPKHFKI